MSDADTASCVLATPRACRPRFFADVGRPQRIEPVGGTLHVTARGVRRHSIYADDADRLYTQPGQTERKWKMIERCRAILAEEVAA